MASTASSRKRDRSASPHAKDERKGTSSSSSSSSSRNNNNNPTKDDDDTYVPYVPVKQRRRAELEKLEATKVRTLRLKKEEEKKLLDEAAANERGMSLIPSRHYLMPSTALKL
jgi:tmRNA-binding protein